jgi:hypothetical protein
MMASASLTHSAAISCWRLRASNRRNNAKLGKMGAPCIGYSVMLANEPMPRAMER